MIFVASICLLNLYSCWEGDERVCVFKTGHFASLRQTGEVKKLAEATEGCGEKVGVGGEGRSCCALHWTVRLSLLFHITIFQSSISPPSVAKRAPPAHVSLKKVGHRSGTPSKRTEETQLLRLPWRKGWFYVAVAVAPDEVCCVDVWRVRIDAHAKKKCGFEFPHKLR